MDHPQASLSHRTQIIPLPAGTNAWCVWEEGEVDGPFPAVAIAQVLTDVTIHGDAVRGRNPRVDTAFGDDGDDERMTSRETSSSLDANPPRVLLLFPDFGDRDSSWVEREHVFFSAETAHAIHRERRASTPRKRGG
jgi:hypothetical protein